MRSAITRDIAVAVNEQEKPVSQSLSTAEASGEWRVASLHSKFLEILKFVFLFEVAHMQEPIMGSWQMSF